MEDVTRRRLPPPLPQARRDLCVTEFVNVEGLLRGCRNARRKIELADDDELTAIQIYGVEPRAAGRGRPLRRGRRAALPRHQLRLLGPQDCRPRRRRGWLRDPAAMVAMARLVVDERVAPGDGQDAHRPRARVAHADRRSRAPARGRGRRRDHDPLPHRADGPLGRGGLVVGGARARGRDHPGHRQRRRPQRGGRRARPRRDGLRRRDGRSPRHRAPVGLPRGARAARPRRDDPAARRPTSASRSAASTSSPTSRRAASRFGVHFTRRHLSGYLKGLPGAAALRQELNQCDSLEGCLAILDAASNRLAVAALRRAAKTPGRQKRRGAETRRRRRAAKPRSRQERGEGRRRRGSSARVLDASRPRDGPLSLMGPPSGQE